MMTKKIVYLVVIAALSGFLFGFDTAVISGADKQIQSLWNLSPLFHGLVIMSSALWGTVVGAMFGDRPLDKYGRKPTLIFIGVLYLFSAIGAAIAWGPFSFAFFRFIGGVGVGASSVAAPTYISEIAPAKDRGKLVALYQFLIVFGILISYLSNYFFDQAGLGENTWRYMMGSVAIPSLIFLLLIFSIPESPRWLVVIKNDLESARKIISSIDPTQDSDKIISEMKNDSQSNVQESIFQSKYVIPVMLSFCIAFFNQASGINFIIYYAPRIFEEAGLNTDHSLFATMGIGLVNLVMTMVGVSLIDKYGRKFLMIIGSIGYIISLALVSRAFFNESFAGVEWFIFLFIASHAIGQGAVIWVYIAEIFPDLARAKGQAFGTTVHWVGASLITLLMPYVLAKFSGGPLFAFFCIMMIGQLIWVLKYMFETKGKTLEQIQANLIK
jgi:MFS transporter, SP family, arabinose:H+ symporter